MNLRATGGLHRRLGVWAGVLFAGALAIWSDHAHALVIQPELHAAAPANPQKRMTDGLPCAACQVALPGQAGLSGDGVSKISAASGWPPGIAEQPRASASTAWSGPLLPLRVLYCRWLN